MIDKCKWCNSEKLSFEKTPQGVHHGKMTCRHCGRFCYWVKNPEKPKSNRKNKQSVKEVCKFHSIENEICFFCLRERKQLGLSETLTVDHIQEISKGGLDILENLQVLCSACHKLKNWSRLYLNWHLNGGEKDGDSKTIM